MNRNFSALSPRTAGAVGVIAALAGLVVALVGQFSTPAVEVESVSFPFTSATMVVVELVLTLTHIGILILALGVRRSGAAGRTRLANVGWVIALAGFAIQVFAEFGYVFAASMLIDDVLPTVLSAVFGVSSILVAVGMVLVGIATLRARVWTGWQRLAPLFVGIASVILIPLVFSEDTRTWGLVLWVLSLAALGAALATSERAKS